MNQERGLLAAPGNADLPVPVIALEQAVAQRGDHAKSDLPVVPAQDDLITDRRRT